MLDESGAAGVEFCWKGEIGRNIVGANQFLVNSESLQLECAWVLYVGLF